MKNVRVIARLDIKNDHVIKGIHLEGLRKVGKPNDLALKYYDQGADEIIFMDAVAAYYDRNSLDHIIKYASSNIFVPITVGGGIRTIDDISRALNSGADKVAINTKAVRDPRFIESAARKFGSQCIVLSVETKCTAANSWEVYIDNGREPTGIDAIEWVSGAESLGAGEIMVTSIDREGTKRGFDLSMNNVMSSVTDLPLIISGGAGKLEHIDSQLDFGGVDALAFASILHYGIASIGQIKEQMISRNIKVRK